MSCIVWCYTITDELGDAARPADIDRWTMRDIPREHGVALRLGFVDGDDAASEAKAAREFEFDDEDLPATRVEEPVRFRPRGSGATHLLEPASRGRLCISVDRNGDGTDEDLLRPWRRFHLIHTTGRPILGTDLDRHQLDR